ncbi:hypothetical protein P3X46_006983 [Hevea brasiliensis]|uniref:MYND-type domain-containing protein n=1 Tax=Hevea brasiliensis TaxID=3981 RepID=A0ABQ9MUH5_HEVBR|nr:hypothetical protein P3X46_006983 [Hevea brasiliensis]
MFEPREADTPVLFLVLVVLPLVAYILLGKWSEATKKREKIDLLAQLATEEALKAEAMPHATATAPAIPFVHPSKNGIHVCARCSSPATTRCSRCKSVRYCSGRCQIIHWRQVHKQECQQSETTSSCSSPNATVIKDSIPERISINDSLNLFYSGYNIKSALMKNAPSENTVHSQIISGISAGTNCSAVDALHEAILQKRSRDKRGYHKSGTEMLIRHDMVVLDSLEETYGTRPACLTFNDTSIAYINGQDSACNMHVIPKYSREPGKIFESRSKYGLSGSLHSGKIGTKVHETEKDIILNGGNMSNIESTFNDETGELNYSYETTVTKGSVKGKFALLPVGTKISKSSKSTTKVFGEQSFSEIEGKGKNADYSKAVRMGRAIPAPGSSGLQTLVL